MKNLRERERRLLQGRNLAASFLSWLWKILLTEKLFQVLKIEYDNGPVAFKCEEISSGINQVSLPAN